jgi:hypothetical protein
MAEPNDFSEKASAVDLAQTWPEAALDVQFFGQQTS